MECFACGNPCAAVKDVTVAGTPARFLIQIYAECPACRGSLAWDIDRDGADVSACYVDVSP